MEVKTISSRLFPFFAEDVIQHRPDRKSLIDAFPVFVRFKNLQRNRRRDDTYGIQREDLHHLVSLFELDCSVVV